MTRFGAGDVTKYELSGLAATAVAAPCPSDENRKARPSRRFPATSQTITLPSLDAEYRVAPPWSKRTEIAAAAWPLYVSRSVRVATSHTSTLPSSAPDASSRPSRLKPSAVTRPGARPFSASSLPERRDTSVKLPSSPPKAAVVPSEEIAAEPEIPNVLVRANVRESRRKDLVSPLVTSRSRPPSTNPIRRPPGIGLERRSTLPSEARRATSTSGGPGLRPVVVSPVTSVRPSGAYATSAVAAPVETSWMRVRCVLVSMSVSVGE